MAENKTPQFSQRDMEISAKAWACLTGDVKVRMEWDMPLFRFNLIISYLVIPYGVLSLSVWQRAR